VGLRASLDALRESHYNFSDARVALSIVQEQFHKKLHVSRWRLARGISDKILPEVLFILVLSQCDTGDKSVSLSVQLLGREMLFGLHLRLEQSFSFRRSVGTAPGYHPISNLVLPEGL